MNPIADRRAELIGLHGKPLVCYLRIWREDIANDQPPCYIVVVTELPDNPGASVTNAAELIASQVCSLYRIEPDTVVWFEHYPGSPHRAKLWRRPDQTPREAETFDRVTFTRLPAPQWAGMAYGDLYLLVDDPCWTSSARHVLETLIGEPFEPIPGQ